MRALASACLASALFLSSCDGSRAGLLGPSGDDSLVLAARADGTVARISWRSSLRGIDSFVLARSLGDTSHFLPMRGFGPRDTAWDDTFATSDVVRWYRLAAVEGSETVRRSNPASCRPVPRYVTDSVITWRDTLGGTAPALHAAADSFRVSLSWKDSGVAGVDGYLLERSRGDTLHFADLARIAMGAVSWKDTSARTADTFWYRLRLRDGHAVSKPSAAVACAPLTRPSPLVVLHEGVAVDVLDLPWGTSRVVVEVENRGDAEQWIERLVPDRSWISASMDDSVLDGRATRLLRIGIDTLAIRDGAFHGGSLGIVAGSGVAAILRIFVAKPVRGLVDPGLRVDSASTSGVVLAWSDTVQPRLRDYVVQRALQNDRVFRPVDTIRSPVGTRWIDTGLGSNTYLEYRLVVHDSLGDSLVSKSVSTVTRPRSGLTVCLHDSASRPLKGGISSQGTLWGENTDSSGCATAAEPGVRDTAWLVWSDGFLSRRIAHARPTKADTVNVTLDTLRTPVDLPTPEGTDFLGAAITGDTVWAVDRDASGATLLQGFVPGGPARVVRRTLGQIMSSGSAGPLAAAGSFLAATFPLDGSVAIASANSPTVRRVALPDSVGSPWGVAGCPDGRFAVAGSGGVAIFDSAGNILDARRIATVVDDVGASHGARLVCGGRWIHLADDGGPYGFVRMDRSTGLFQRIELRAPVTPRFVASVHGRVVVATSGGTSYGIQHLDSAMVSTNAIDASYGRITALAATTDRFGSPISITGFATGSGGELRFADFRGGSLGSVALEEPPVEIVARGGLVLIVYPDHLAILRLHGG